MFNYIKPVIITLSSDKLQINKNLPIEPISLYNRYIDISDKTKSIKGSIIDRKTN